MTAWLEFPHRPSTTTLSSLHVNWPRIIRDPLANCFYLRSKLQFLSQRIGLHCHARTASQRRQDCRVGHASPPQQAYRTTELHRCL